MIVDFALSEEQQLMRDMLERFALEHYPVADRPGYSVPETGFAPEAWRRLAELGILALPFAEESGGFGATPADLMILGEAFGRAVVPEPVLAGILFAARLLERAGTEAQRHRWLGPVMQGEAHLAVAFAEPGSRHALDRLDARCAEGRLHGDKTFVLGGSATDAFIVTARRADGSAGLYLCEAGGEGVSTRAYRLLDGSPALEVSFDGAAAEELGRDAGALDELVEELRVPIVAEMVGLMATLLDQTLDYVKVRKQFGTAIGSFQAIQHRLADQYLALEQSRSLLFKAALASPVERRTAGLAAKAYVSRAAIGLGEEAIQLHGGMGITDELIIGHAHKRVLVLANLFGDADTEVRRYLEATR